MYNKRNESYSYDANFNMKIIVAQLIVGNFSQVSVTLRTFKKIPQTPFTMILNIYLKSQNKIMVSQLSEVQGNLTSNAFLSPRLCHCDT